MTFYWIKICEWDSECVSGFLTLDFESKLPETILAIWFGCTAMPPFKIKTVLNG